MKEILTVHVKGRYIVIPKLIGAFFIIVAALMLVYASLDAVTAWDRVKDIRSCVAGIYSADDPVAAYQTCIMKGMAAGVYVYTPERLSPEKAAVPDEEFWAVMMPKFAQWLFWVVILIIAILMYQWGKLVIPVEEKVTEVANVPAPKNEAKEETQEKPKRRTRRTTRRTTKKR